MFELSFHLPYYAWRRVPNPRIDRHQYEDMQPLRGVQDVSFLDWSDSKPSSFLYEAQISFTAAGSDDRRWVAYCFVDTDFETEDDRETVLKYYDGLAPQDMRVDPCTRGKTMADGKFQTPREYFLTVLRFRIQQIKSEWRQVVGKLKESIRGYEQVCPLASPLEPI